MTTNYFTAIATGAAANASTFNTPLGTLDAQITANTASAALAAVTTAEVVTARDSYASLDARLDALVLAGSSTSTLTNGVANAGQKDITVVSTTGFLAGALIAYTLVGGVIETNTVSTVTPTVITCTGNVGTGGIANGTYVMVIPLGSLVSTGTVAGATAQAQEFTMGLDVLGRITSGSGTVGYGGVGTNVLFLAVEDITAHAHYAFLDNSVIDYVGGGTLGHASFAGYPAIEGSANQDHQHTFQDRQSFAGSGVINSMIGFYTVADVTGAGSVTAYRGLYVGTPNGAGTIGTIYGVYVEGSNTRGTANYAFFSNGSAKSQFGGNLIIKSDGAAVDALVFKQTGAERYEGRFNLESALGLKISSYDTTGTVYLPIAIQSSVLILNGEVGNGRVGIGEKTPDSVLHVAGATIIVANGAAEDALTLKQTGAERYQARFSLENTVGLKLSVYDADTATFLPAYIRGSSLILNDIAGTGSVGIGTASPAAKLHVDQSSLTGAVPVLTVDQADVSEEFIRFIGTSTTDATQSLVDAANMTTPGAIVGWLKIYVQDDQATNPITDGVYFVPFYAAPSA